LPFTALGTGNEVGLFYNAPKPTWGGFFTEVRKWKSREGTETEKKAKSKTKQGNWEHSLVHKGPIADATASSVCLYISTCYTVLSTV